jgi:hypothetical protein
MNMLAETMVSGDWLTGLIVAVIGATGSAMVAYRKGAASTAQPIALRDPVPTVPTSKVSTPPSWDAHKALCERVTRQESISNELRHDLSEVRKDMAIQYRELMRAGSERETNLSDKLDGIARGIHSRIDDLVKPKPSR